MSVVAHLAARDFVAQPWKNGGGTTTELAAFPAGARPLWRVSIADVARDGPFSDFSGYERTIMLLEGAGMVLAFDGREPERIERRLQPFTFDGAWRCDCSLLAGPVRDLNLMVDREAARGTIEVLWPRARMARNLRADWTLAFAAAGTARFFLGEAEYRVPTGDILRIDGPSDEPLSFECDGADAALAILEVQRQRR
jgi:environmental stress-induced protein Ves